MARGNHAGGRGGSRGGSSRGGGGGYRGGHTGRGGSHGDGGCLSAVVVFALGAAGALYGAIEIVSAVI